mmetsp:Transcript_13385/g.31698  ORF Transcript_13385/g.31698 Transcript_13385/m.31698 type:complete len:204 (+) Transcript_13385:441-1052(+)
MDLRGDRVRLGDVGVEGGALPQEGQALCPRRFLGHDPPVEVAGPALVFRAEDPGAPRKHRGDNLQAAVLGRRVGHPGDLAHAERRLEDARPQSVGPAFFKIALPPKGLVMIVSYSLEQESTNFLGRAVHRLSCPNMPESNALRRHTQVLHNCVLHVLAINNAEFVDKVLRLIADHLCQSPPVLFRVEKVHANKGVGVCRVEQS